MKIVTIDQPNIKDFSKVRNQALNTAKTDWVMFLDSDEKLFPDLQQEILKVQENKNFNYQFKRQDFLLGKPLYYGETSSTRFARLIQPGTGKWQGKVHERFISTIPVKTLTLPLQHQPLSISSLLKKLDQYSSLRSLELKQFSLFQLLFYPPLKFIQNYIIRLGFLDGISGLGMAFMMSLHSLFVRVKIYEKTFKA